MPYKPPTIPAWHTWTAFDLFAYTWAVACSSLTLGVGLAQLLT